MKAAQPTQLTPLDYADYCGQVMRLMRLKLLEPKLIVQSAVMKLAG